MADGDSLANPYFEDEDCGQIVIKSLCVLLGIKSQA
jgi:hypothetical protein